MCCDVYTTWVNILQGKVLSRTHVDESIKWMNFCFAKQNCTFMEKTLLVLFGIKCVFSRVYKYVTKLMKIIISLPTKSQLQRPYLCLNLLSYFEPFSIHTLLTTWPKSSHCQNQSLGFICEWKLSPKNDLNSV